jgi:hypothetical protein
VREARNGRPAANGAAPARSRARRSAAGLVAPPGRIARSRLGSQRRPSRISMVVTASTVSCVSARSGAENQMKVRETATPATPASMTAARRCRLAIQAAAIAAAPPTIQRPAKVGASGRTGRGPGPAPSRSASSASRSVTITIARSWTRNPARRSLRRAHQPPSVSLATVAWNTRPPSRRRPAHAGSRADRSRRRRTTYAATPPAIATRLITNGRLNPCQTARS